MSDFDKEKEREKLRKKFEQEEERRETTQQMSELLLKGATMMNLHCADCASPIFRHEGQEFCPTCQRPVEELTTAGPGDVTGAGGPPTGGQQSASSEGSAAENADAGTEIAVEDPQAQSESESETEPEPEPDAQTAPETEPEPEPDLAPEPDNAADATRQAPTDAGTPDRDATGREHAAGIPADRPVDAYNENAVESLTDAIARLSERAAAAEDPRQAQDLLAAANEAADVLQRLRE